MCGGGGGVEGEGGEGSGEQLLYVYMYMYVTQPSQLSCLSSSAGWLGEGMCVWGGREG